MKRFIVLPMIAWTLAGCLQFEPDHRHSSARPAVPASAIATPIIADQVNHDNARRMAQALWDEIEHDDQPPAPLSGRGR